MKPASLRQFANRHGMVGLLLVGAYLVVWHLWTRRRFALLAGIAILLVSASLLSFSYYTRKLIDQHSAFHASHQLYVGQIRAEAPDSPQPMEDWLLAYWEEGSRTDEIRKLTSEFAQSVAHQDRVRAVNLGNRLYPLFHPNTFWDKDGKWNMQACVGQIYLEKGWLDEAEHEFKSVLSAVPPDESGWGKSRARQMSAYGLARSCALHESYESALKYLEQAPHEYNSGCGNCRESVAIFNYPMQVVWTAASKPFSVAEPELRAIMRGHFAPMGSWLNGDTSAIQRQHAAVEAGLTLGCLYDKAGRRSGAEACWSLVAYRADPHFEATEFARVMLDRLQHK